MYSTTLRYVGRRVREQRQRSGETIEDVARALRMSASGISQVEHGRALPSLSLLDRLSDHFRIDIRTFFEGTPEPRHGAAELFMRKFEASLEAEDWDALAAVANALIKKSQVKRAPESPTSETWRRP